MDTLIRWANERARLACVWLWVLDGGTFWDSCCDRAWAWWSSVLGLV